jgi:uncharacterized protein (DUF3084 family)
MLTNRAQAAKARVLAEYAAGTVGFHARMMHDLTPAEFRALGKQADAELLARDAIIHQKENAISSRDATIALKNAKIESQAARIAVLEAEVARLNAKKG